MTRSILLLFGATAYLIFFVTFLCLIAFVGNFPFAPLAIDRGASALAPVPATAIDLGLIAIFAFQHSVMARPGFKAGWTRLVPPPVERSVYVLFASLALILLMVLWQPLPQSVWSVGDGALATFLRLLFALGWVIVLVSTFLISHFELFGLKQVWNHLRGRDAEAPVFRQPLFYRVVRHPLYTGFFLAFWATPVMSVGHLLLAGGLSLFMLGAIRLEESDLTDVFGQDYVDYRARTGMLLPRLRRHGG